MTQYTERTNSTEAIAETFDFGTFDKKGRRIGCIITMWEETYEPTPSFPGWMYEPGHYYVYQPWITRNGKPYGPEQFTTMHKTEADRLTAIEKYLNGARKRSLKK